MGVDGDGEARGVSNGFGTAAAALGDPCDRDAERDWECECPWEYCEDEDVGEAGTAGTAGGTHWVRLSVVADRSWCNH